MTNKELVEHRLYNQQITHHKFRKPADLVKWMGAIQAQDYPGGLWAIGLRTGATRAEIEKTIADKKIVRTWPMRGTLHFVIPEDIRWILDLTISRMMSGISARQEYLKLNEGVFIQARKVFIKALSGGKALTRRELYGVMEKGNVGTANQRGLHILRHLSQHQLLCFGPHIGKQPTFCLLDEHTPESKKLDHEQAVIEFAERYFTSHGPATIQDFCWWSGLKVSDAKAGIASLGSKLKEIKIGDKVYYDLTRVKGAHNGALLGVHLLPPFDEYLVAYKDRSAAVDPVHTRTVFGPGNGIFSPVIIVDGRVVGTWAKIIKKDKIIIKTNLFSKLTKVQSEGLSDAAECYGKFMGMKVEL